MHIDLLVTKLQAFSALTTIAGTALGAALHALSLRYHIRLTSTEVNGGARLIEKLIPGFTPEVEIAKAALDMAIKTEAPAPSPAPAPAPTLAPIVPAEPSAS